MHDVVHILIGVAGLVLARTLAGARSYGWLLAVGSGRLPQHPLGEHTGAHRRTAEERPRPPDPRGTAMDDDTVLRTLGEDLARDDPRLAALLSGSRGSTRQWGARSLFLLLLAIPVLTTAALLVPPTVAVGVLTMLLAVGSPLAVCWLVTTSERTPPRPR